MGALLSGNAVPLLSLTATLQGGAFTHGWGLTGLVGYSSADGSQWLVAGSRADGGMTSFALGQGAVAVLSDSVDYSLLGGTYALQELAPVSIGGQSMLMASGAYEDALGLWSVDNSGMFSAPIAPTAGSDSTARYTEFESVDSGGSTFVVAGRSGTAGLDVFQVTGSGQFTQTVHVNDKAAWLLDDVADMASATIGGTPYVFTASAFASGVTSLEVNPTGALSLRDQFDASKGTGINQVTTLETVISGGQTYLAAGAWGTNNLSLFAVDQGGKLTLTDLVMDTQDTRFQGVTALETIETGDRSFLLAGGSDGGVTLFEVIPDGQLSLVETVIDSNTTTLGNVLDVTAVNVGAEVQVFISSETEEGLTQFNFDTTSLGATQIADTVTPNLTGSSLGDLLVGDDSANVLTGGAGDDRIVDGGGQDTLTGGAGSDTFVLRQDGWYDRITDFEPGTDRLDFSGFDQVYGLANLTITSTTYGARITAMDEVLRLETIDGSSLSSTDFAATDFNF